MERWLTYAAAGELLGMTPEAVRHLARRRRWRTQPGNDGKRLILLPDDPGVRQRVHTPDQPAVHTPVQSPVQFGEVDALRELVAELRGQLTKAEAQVVEVQQAQEADRERHTQDIAWHRAELDRARQAVEAVQRKLAAAEAEMAVASHERDALRAAETERAAWSWRRRMMWAVRGR
jgi:hypothetical protein